MRNKSIIQYLFLLLVLLVSISAISAANVDNTTTDTSTVQQETVETTQDTVTSNPIIKTDTKIEDNNLQTNTTKKDKITKNTKTDNVKTAPLQDINLSTPDIECTYGKVVPVDVTTNPTVHEGLLTWYVDESVVAIRDLSEYAPTYSLITSSFLPGTHEIMVTYSASEHYANNYTTARLVLNKINTTISDIDMEYDSNNDISVTLNVVGDDGEILDFGTFNVYQGNTLVKSIEMEDYDVIFTLNKTYNMENLLFEYIGDDIYADTSSLEYINLPLKELTITTDNNISANVEDIVSIPFTFNDTVSDGTVSVSYGGSPDNTITVTTGTDSILFDTTDYMQGEYELELSYYDGHVFLDNSTTITLYLYQPTTIAADCDSVNVVLGKGNEYTVNFETSLDSWGDVIWGSIDVYIDDNIIDTIIIDDSTGNTGSI